MSPKQRSLCVQDDKTNQRLSKIFVTPSCDTFATVTTYDGKNTLFQSASYGLA